MIWWMLMAAVPLDPVGDPLPRYLTLGSVEAVVASLQEPLSQCAASEAVTVRLGISVKPDGALVLIDAEPADHPAEPCWRQAIEGHVGPTHDDLPQRVDTTLYVRDGQTLLSPATTIQVRQMTPLMLFVTGEARDAVNDIIHGPDEPIQ